jgi:hypothetical protein
MDNKGQVSLEAVLVIGIAILVVISMFNIWWARMSMAREVGEAGEAKMIGILLAEGINLAYANGANFSITLTEDEINYTRLSEVEKMEGGGVKLPIVIDIEEGNINITKDMSKTGGDTWNTTVSIVPANIVMNTSSDYPETTIRNNGTSIIIYANSGNIKVVS